jgi:hypothetical protein
MTMQHGAMPLFDPSDPLGVAVVIIGMVLTGLAFVLAIRWTIVPGETEADHPKRIVLREDR